MGKKGTWFSAIKRLFTSTSTSTSNPNNQEPKQNKRRLKHGSFLPGRFREPSSIEKILGEVDQQQILYHHPYSSPHLSNSRPVDDEIQPPLVLQHLSATRIQAAYRGYMARKRRKRTSGLVRLEDVVRSQHVKRQTVNAMKQMQLLVRIQTQIHSRRRIQQPLNKQQLLSESEMGNEEDWDDSLITKEEREARLQRKVEAVIKRNKAMAYAYSHQLWKATPKSAQNSIPIPIPIPIPSGWWWSHHFPSCDVKFASTPSTSRPTTPHLIKKKQNNISLSPRSMVPPRTRQRMKYSYSNSNSIKDDDSLMSCPPFSSVPNYMTPTVSAKAKARPTSNPRDRMPSSPGSVSFPPTPNSNTNTNGSVNWKKGNTNGSVNWKKGNTNGSVNWKKGSGSKHKSPGSIGELSMDSALGR